MPSWSGLPMPQRPGSGAVRIDAACERVSKARRPVWLLALWLFSVDIALAMSCKPPDRQPTAEEREQLDVYERRLNARDAALSAALRGDPLLGPTLERFAQIGVTLPDPTGKDPDVLPPIEDALRLAQEDELLALIALARAEDLNEAERRGIIERWRAQGLPWTALAAWPADLEKAADRQRFAAVLQESLDLPINNPLAIRVRTLGIRYFELVEQHPVPQLPEALWAVYPGCIHGWRAEFVAASVSLEVTTLPLHYLFLQQECSEPHGELEVICTSWSERLRRESFEGWADSLDGQRGNDLSERIDVCGPLALLRAVQDHHGDWEAVEARLLDCVPPAAEAADRAPD